MYDMVVDELLINPSLPDLGPPLSPQPLRLFRLGSQATVVRNSMKVDPTMIAADD